MPDTAYALKRCAGCKAEKPLDQFPADRSRKDGCMCRCRSCDNERSKRYYKRNREQVLARERKTKPPKPRACPRCTRRITVARKRYCSDTCRRQARQEADRARVSNHQNKRRTAKRYTDITPADEQRIRRAKRCGLCNCTLTQANGPRKGHLDHIIPIAAGGTHTHGNVRMLCRTCNLTRPIDGSDVAEQPTLWAQDHHVFASLQDRQQREREQRQAKVHERHQVAALRRYEKRCKALLALSLRTQGWSWQAITDTLGYANTSGPYLAIQLTLGVDPKGITR